MTRSDYEPSVVFPAISAGALRSARQLLKRRGRDVQQAFLAEGPQAVREALRDPTRVAWVVVANPAQVELVAATDVPVYSATAEQFRTLSDTVASQGVLAVCRQFNNDLGTLPLGQLTVICDRLRDPGNVGTVIRCADAFGASTVILTTASVELFNPKTVRASVGSIFHLPVATGVSLEAAVGACRTAGQQVLASDAGGRSLADLAAAGQLQRPTAWVFGNEAWGYADSDLAAVDEVVSIPMWGQAESLNVSTAAAVCLYASASALNPKS